MGAGPGFRASRAIGAARAGPPCHPAPPCRIIRCPRNTTELESSDAIPTRVRRACPAGGPGGRSATAHPGRHLPAGVRRRSPDLPRWAVGGLCPAMAGRDDGPAILEPLAGSGGRDRSSPAHHREGRGIAAPLVAGREADCLSLESRRVAPDLRPVDGRRDDPARHSADQSAGNVDLVARRQVDRVPGAGAEAGPGGGTADRAAARRGLGGAAEVHRPARLPVRRGRRGAHRVRPSLRRSVRGWHGPPVDQW